MPRLITACLLLVAFSLHTLNRVVVYVDYYTNTAAFAKDCENKALPEMHCNGKCQMMKKLKEQEKKESRLPERKPVNNDQISSSFYTISTEHFTTLIVSAYNLHLTDATTDISRSVFHPPGA